MTRCIGMLVVLSAIPLLAEEVCAGPFTPGNLAVYRVGTGSAALSATSTEVFIDEYTTSGTFVQSIAMPTSSPTTALTASGTINSEGYLTRSTDGQFLVLTGYGTRPGFPEVATSTSTLVNRVVGVVDANANIDTTTRLAFYGGNGPTAAGGTPNGVASTNGTDLWAAGSLATAAQAGANFTTKGSTGTNFTHLSNDSNNVRGAQIVGGQLFVSVWSGVLRIGTVGNGLPTTGSQTITDLPGITVNNVLDPYGFYLADLDPTANYLSTGIDTLYVADDGSDSVKKFVFNGTTWIQKGSISLNGARGLTGSVNGSTVTLYSTADGSSSTQMKLETLQDASGFDQNMTGSWNVLATAANNTVFRGVALTPVAIAEPRAIALGTVVLLIGIVGFLARLGYRGLRRSLHVTSVH